MLYLSTVKDYFNKEIVSFYTSIHNDVFLIKDSYKDLIINEEAIEEIKKYVHWHNNERIQNFLSIEH